MGTRWGRKGKTQERREESGGGELAVTWMRLGSKGTEVFSFLPYLVSMLLCQLGTKEMRREFVGRR